MFNHSNPKVNHKSSLCNTNITNTPITGEQLIIGEVLTGIIRKVEPEPEPATPAPSTQHRHPKKTIPAPLTQKERLARLATKALQDWQASGIDDNITKLHIQPAPANRIFQVIYGDTYPTPLSEEGKRKLWAIEQNNWEGYVIFGPNGYKRIKFLNGPKDSDGDPIKYLSPKGSHNKAFFPGTVDFWAGVVADTTRVIIITEGEKKAASLVSRGVAAIGISGIFNGCVKDCPLEVLPEIKELAAGRDFKILFDNDEKETTRRNCKLAQRRLALALKRAGAGNISLGNTPDGPHKGIDDYLVAGGSFDDVNWVSLADDLLLRDWEFTFKGDFELALENLVKGRYIPTDITIPASKQSIILKAPKGAGKTNFIKHFCEGRKAVVLTGRIALGQKQAADLGAEYKSSTGIHTVITIQSLIDSQNPGRWDEVLAEKDTLILDEATGLFRSLVAEGTMSNRRCPTLQKVTEIIKNILAKPDGKVILADADLEDTTINNYCKVAGLTTTKEEDGKFYTQPAREKLFVVSGNIKQPPYTVYWYSNKKPDTILEAAFDAAKNGKTIWIQCTAKDGKYGANKIARKFSDAGLSTLEITGGKGGTCHEIGHPALGIAHNLDRLKNYQVVVSTGVISAGLSIEFEHFDAWYGINLGNIPGTEFMQSTYRIRLPGEYQIPRHIWISSNPPRETRIANGALWENEILATADRKVETELRHLQRADNLVDRGEPINFELQAPSESVGRWRWFYAQSAARDNRVFDRYRAWVRLQLQQEGHTIIDVDSADIPTTGIGKELAELKQAMDLEKDEALQKAEDISDEEKESLSKADSLTKADSLKLERYFLKRKFGVKTELPPHLYLLSKMRGWSFSLSLAYWLNRKHLRHILANQSVAKIEKHKAQNNGEIWAADISNKLLLAAVNLLEKLNIARFQTPCSRDEAKEKGWHKGHPEVEKFLSDCRENAKELQAIFGIKLTEDTNKRPFYLIDRLLSKIGQKLTSVQVKEDNVSTRYYYFDEDPTKHLAAKPEKEHQHLRPLIYSNWDITNSNWMENYKQDCEYLRYSNETAEPAVPDWQIRACEIATTNAIGYLEGCNSAADFATLASLIEGPVLEAAIARCTLATQHRIGTWQHPTANTGTQQQPNTPQPTPALTTQQPTANTQQPTQQPTPQQHRYQAGNLERDMATVRDLAVAVWDGKQDAKHQLVWVLNEIYYSVGQEYYSKLMSGAGGLTQTVVASLG